MKTYEERYELGVKDGNTLKFQLAGISEFFLNQYITAIGLHRVAACYYNHAYCEGLNDTLFGKGKGTWK